MPARFFGVRRLAAAFPPLPSTDPRFDAQPEPVILRPVVWAD